MTPGWVVTGWGSSIVATRSGVTTASNGPGSPGRAAPAPGQGSRCSAAASAAPTKPASFCSWAGTTGVRVVSSGTHFCAI